MHSPVHLLSLPAEIRLIIYSFVFTDEWTYFNSCNPTSEPSQIQDSSDRLSPPLLRTCQRLRNEAAAVYYSNLQVHFDITNGTIPPDLINWLNSIGEPHATLLQHFEIRWANYADISLDLRPKPSCSSSSSRTTKHPTPPNPTPHPPQSDTILIQTYHRRLSALLLLHQQQQQQQATTSKPSSYHTHTHTRHLFIPLLQLHPTTTKNPTTSYQTGRNHFLTVKGVPLSTAILPTEFWEINGTAEFCRILSKSLSDWLDGDFHLMSSSSSSLSKKGGRRRGGGGGAFKNVEGIVEFVGLVNEHASALRWLGFW